MKRQVVPDALRCLRLRYELCLPNCVYELASVSRELFVSFCEVMVMNGVCIMGDECIFIDHHAVHADLATHTPLFLVWLRKSAGSIKLPLK